MKRVQLLMILTFIIVVNVTAQNNFFGITYNTAMPLGETKDFIDKYSWGAMALEWKKMVNDRVGIGLNLSWQILSQKIDHGTLNVPETNVTLSGTQLRYLNYFPITVSACYFFNPEGRIIPFMGAGTGMYRILQRFDISGYVFQDNTWNFGFFPEFGLLVPTGGPSDFFVNTKYHYILPSAGGITHSYLNINIGFSYFY